MSEQVKRTTSLYLRADDSPDGALARLADVVRHVMREKGIPLRPAARLIAERLGDHWKVATVLASDQAANNAPSFLHFMDRDFDRSYRTWVEEQTERAEFFAASRADTARRLPCGRSTLHPVLWKSRHHLFDWTDELTRLLPPVIWIAEMWGGRATRIEDLYLSSASTWCIRASLAAELFGYGDHQMDAGTGPDEGELTGVDREVRIVQDYWTEKERGTKSASGVVGERYGISGRWVTSLAKKHADVPGGKAAAPETLEQAWHAKPRKSA
ncbi:hypothetical protein KGA65_00380 [Ideonella sp. B7]|uniref:hypothetical protein n=1 Tax=Ideonella benzenivorans TaxID=2831643 RepID=UPI001CEC75C1|nr:hypothetical protein [Ideonella benzenivorans]MCA6214988.1 hypothetical protein [Ideonella benzenivorans]